MYPVYGVVVGAVVEAAGVTEVGAGEDDVETVAGAVEVARTFTVESSRRAVALVGVNVPCQPGRGSNASVL